MLSNSAGTASPDSEAAASRGEYSAEDPELHRLVTMEARRVSERLVWVINTTFRD